MLLFVAFPHQRCLLSLTVCSFFNDLSLRFVRCVFVVVSSSLFVVGCVSFVGLFGLCCFACWLLVCGCL